MKQLLAALCACLVLGLVAAGCGGDDDSGDSGDSGSAATTEQTTTTEKPAAGSGATAGKQVEIEVVDIDYDPKSATVPAGATVKWTNTGDLPHTVTKDGGPGEDFDSGTLQPGDTFEQTFDAAGTIDYLCTIHSGQTGSLTVE
jgi:plastocyanin